MMTSKSRSHHDYKVGWICALSKEQTAAMAMLDEEHDLLPKPPSDSNVYTLGSISGHNIVIACLPEGQIGTNSAATVATQMVNTFPSVRFGLLVGIGSGIPPRVRLGDVVVSQPSGGHPGVVQWDFGKAEQEGQIVQTGSLNQPPGALLAALTKLKSRHEMKGHNIHKLLDQMTAKWPRLAPNYTCSARLKDPLYSSPRATSDFSAVKESRKPGEISIHYGLIASGNQVIKDSATRDRINKSLAGQVLCFDMEAAGLMKSFPCTVIRGICDYADSLKKKDWQDYAAAIAAAFAKELLESVQPTDIEGDKRASEVLKQSQYPFV
ncbi:nucleoside phosphorylase domain-containing protein [Trichoderma sp. SZMC 28013]